MRYCLPVLAIFALLVASSPADAKSCSGFAVIKSYDAATKTVEVEYGKGKMAKFFPKPEGTPRDSQKIPKSCRGKTKKTTSLVVKPTGGRMSVTQLRSNFEGKMLNDTEDEAWVPGEIQKLVDAEAQVVIVVRPGMGKDAPLGVTTIYLPITDEELAEIERIDAQASDV
jgi:hypothetical protein